MIAELRSSGMTASARRKAARVSGPSPRLLSLVVLPALLFAGTSRADRGAQIFVRGGLSFLGDDRGGQVLTDTSGAAGRNDGKLAWNFSIGLDKELVQKLGPGALIGEFMLDYAHFSDKTVLQPTSALFGGMAKSNITVAELGVVCAAKYRFELLNGKLRPWIIPVGIAFLINSPPSNDVTSIDLGYQLGAGIEYRVIPALSIGADVRYTCGFGEIGFNILYGTAHLYQGANF